MWDVGHSLEEASLVLLLIVGPKLDLALEASKLTGLVEGDRVGAIEDVISCLENTRRWVLGVGVGIPLPVLPPPLPTSPTPGKSSPHLHIKKVQLYGVPGVHILV